MVKTMQDRTTEKIGPGSYLKDSNLNMIGKLKTSNSVKGFGNGFASKAERGLETTVLIKTTNNLGGKSSQTTASITKLKPTLPIRSHSV